MITERLSRTTCKISVNIAAFFQISEQPFILHENRRFSQLLCFLFNRPRVKSKPQCKLLVLPILFFFFFGFTCVLCTQTQSCDQNSSSNNKCIHRNVANLQKANNSNNNHNGVLERLFSGEPWAGTFHNQAKTIVIKTQY